MIDIVEPIVPCKIPQHLIPQKIQHKKVVLRILTYILYKLQNYTTTNL